MEVRFSIRYKLLFLVTILVLGAISAHLYFATRAFRKDKTQFIFDSNQTAVKTFASHLDTGLRSMVDKLRLFSLIYNGSSRDSEMASFKEILETDPLLVDIEMYDSTGTQLATEMTQSRFLKLYSISASYFDNTIPETKAVPIAEIGSKNIAVWNATIPHGPPLIGVGVLIEIKDINDKLKTMMVVGYVKADLFLKDLKDAEPTQLMVLDSKGRALLHTDVSKMVVGKNYSKIPLLREIQASSSGVMKYNYLKKDFLGAYSRVNLGGLTVLSYIESDLAFAVVKKLINHSVVVGLIIITLAFIISLSYLKSVTNPLLNLVAAMKNVADGNLATQFQVETKDEIGVLSRVFTKMTGDLKSSRNQLEEVNKNLEKLLKSMVMEAPAAIFAMSKMWCKQT